MRAWCVFSLLTVCAPRAAFAEAPIVAVFGVEGGDSKLSARALSALTTYFTATLSSGAAFKVIPSDELRARLGAAKADSYKACFDQSCQIEIGRELAAQKTVSTKVFRVGKRCVVTTTIFDLRTSVSDRSATRETKCGEDDVVDALKGIAEELKSPLVPAAPPPKPTVAPAPTAVTEPNALEAWEQIEGGDYEARDGGFVGSAGRLGYLHPIPADFVVELDAELVGGTRAGIVGVCWHAGGPKGQAINRGYCSSFGWSNTRATWMGVGGAWKPLTPGIGAGQYNVPTDRVQPKTNRLRLEVKGQRAVISLNGAPLETIVDATLTSGRLFLSVSGGSIVKLSNVTIRPL